MDSENGGTGTNVPSSSLLGSYSFRWQQGGFVVLTVPQYDEFGERVLVTHGLSITTARELHAQLTAVLDLIKADAAALVAAHPMPNARPVRTDGPSRDSGTHEAVVGRSEDV